jgi:hypothetical protein
MSSRYVEYWIHYEDGDLDCLEGREWRYVRNELIPRCEDSDTLALTVLAIERVVRTYYASDDFDVDYETLWRRP